MKPIQKKTLLICGAVAVGAAYLGLFNHTPHGTQCIQSVSPDRIYRAERCFLNMESYRTEDARYVARLFDNKTGNLLVENVYTTPVPDLFWTPGFYAVDPQFHYIGPAVNFQRGGEDGDGSSISLPPSMWDRLLAHRPRL